MQTNSRLSTTPRERNGGLSKPVLWLSVGLTVLLSAGGMILFWLNSETATPGSWGSAGGVGHDALDWLQTVFSWTLFPISSALLGVLTLRRHPRHPIGRLLLLTGVLAGLQGLLEELAVYGYFGSSSTLPGALMAAWVVNWLWVVLFTLLILMIFVFPNGRFLSRRWAMIGAISLFLFAGPMLLSSMFETPMSSAYAIPNPFVTTHPERLYNFFFTLAVPMMPVALVLSLIALLARFARTARDEVELAALQRELRAVVRDSIQPNGITIWLRPVEENEI